jgi:hypothetical protein
MDWYPNSPSALPISCHVPVTGHHFVYPANRRDVLGASAASGIGMGWGGMDDIHHLFYMHIFIGLKKIH